MQNKETKTEKALGAGTERKVGKASTLKSFGVTVKNVKDAKLLNEEDQAVLKSLHEKAVKQYLGFELGI